MNSSITLHVSARPDRGMNVTYQPAEGKCDEKDGEHHGCHEEEGQKTDGTEQSTGSPRKRLEREHLGEFGVRDSELLHQ